MTTETPPRLLYVEDDTGFARLAQRRLTRAGYDVVLAAGCGEAVGKLAEGRFDLILADYLMPDGTGPELLTRVAETADPPPVIMVSGILDLPAAVRAMKEGAVDWIVKESGDGFFDLLAASIERALGWRRLAAEKAQAEAELRQVRHHLQEIAQNVRVVPWKMDPRTLALTYVGPAIETMLGYPLARWYDTGFWHDVVHPKDRARVDRATRSLSASRASFEMEFRVLAAHGETVWLQNIVSVEREDGTPRSLRGYSIDVTARKRLETSMAETRTRHAEAQRIARIGHYDYDIAADRWTCTDMLKEILGIADTHEMTAAGWLALVHPDMRDDMTAYLDAIVAGRRARFDREYRIVTHDQGTERWLHGLGIVETGDGGAPLRMFGTIQDIDARKRTELALQETTERHQAIVQTANDVIVTADADGRIASWNAAGQRLLGYAEAEILGRPLESVLPAALVQASPPGSGDGPGGLHAPVASTEVVAIHRDGRRIPVEISISAWQVGGEQFRTAILRDITERRAAEARLRQSATVFESTDEGVIITGPDSRIIDVNRAFCEITGYGADEVRGELPNLLRSGRHDRDFYADMWRAIQQTGQWRGEIWNRRKNGEIFPEWLTISTVRDAAGQVANYVGVFSDITAIKQAEETIQHLAHHHPLTDLPNRLLFVARCGHSVERAKRSRKQLAMLILDLDGFKHVNESFGHSVGDEVLKVLAQRLETQVRGIDTLAHFGGDEFALVMEQVDDLNDIIVMVDKLQACMNVPFTTGTSEVFLTISIGISVYPEDGVSVNELARNADAALFRAKEMGRNTYQFYTGELTRVATDRVRWQSDLRRGFENGELEVYYQPQVDLLTDAVIGVEALLRWRHPQMGLLTPGRFIGVAEDCGLIVPMGEFVLRTACSDMVAWRARGVPVPRAAVNVSGKQIQRGGFADLVARVLSETGCPPEALELEITESFIMHETRESPDTITELKKLNVFLSVDDFGTGYSSLSRLKRLPFDRLKIDQSFVRGIDTDAEDTAIVKTIISLGRELGLEVLAEGVESEAQAGVLRDQGCVYAQGYLYGHAMPREALEEFMVQSARRPRVSGYPAA